MNVTDSNAAWHPNQPIRDADWADAEISAGRALRHENLSLAREIRVPAGYKGKIADCVIMVPMAA